MWFREYTTTPCDPVNLKADLRNAALDPDSSLYHEGNAPDFSHEGNAPDFSNEGNAPDLPLSSNSMGSSSLNVYDNSVSNECTVKCLSTMSSSVNSNQNPVCESRDDINYSSSNKPMVEVFLNGQPVSFELDTGAALTCIDVCQK